MEAVIFAVVIGLVLLVFFAVGEHFSLAELREDLEKYLVNAKQVVEIADDPRVIIHYKAVVTAVSGILSKHFPVKE